MSRQYDKAVARINELCNLTVIRDLATSSNKDVTIDAIFGSPATESSFKSILGIGLILMALDSGQLKKGQTIIESTSGSLGAGIAAAGQILGHPIVLVTDKNIPIVTRSKIELLGANLVIVDDPDPEGGFQKAREDKLISLLDQHPDWFWTKQNDSDQNPLVYEKYLLPALLKVLTPRDYAAGIFCVGSGGHFSAMSKMLASYDIPSYVADREGSVTFGGAPASSSIRGSGNHYGVPGVIQAAMDRVKGVYVVKEDDAYRGVGELAERGIYVGPSSGVCWSGAQALASDIKRGKILTFFPDRAELYGPDIFSKITELKGRQ